jgi:hypothetical protein
MTDCSTFWPAGRVDAMLRSPSIANVPCAVVGALMLLLASCHSSQLIDGERCRGLLSIHEANPWSGIHYFSDAARLTTLVPKSVARVGIDDLGDEIVPFIMELKGVHTLAFSSSSQYQFPNYPSQTTITDEGVIMLSRHPSVMYLLIEYARITDKCLLAIAGMPALRYLSVSYCNGVTATGIEEFMKIRPDVRVEFIEEPLLPDEPAAPCPDVDE